MNARLAAIDRAAAILHAERARLDSAYPEGRHGAGYGGRAICRECLEMAARVVDEVLPVLIPPTPAERIVASTVETPVLSNKIGPGEGVPATGMEGPRP